MRASRFILIALILCGTCCGCPAWRWRYPWQPPGTIYEQGNRATIHDPFPDVDLGPELPDVRPREFSTPLDLPVRDRLFPDSVGRR